MEEQNVPEKRRKIRPIVVIATIGLIILFLIIVGAAVMMSQPKGPSAVNVTIQISTSTTWSGSIGANGQSTTVSGSGSKSYPLTGSIIVAVIQMQTDQGYLTVSIIVNGETKASQSTTAAYGVVTVSWSS